MINELNPRTLNSVKFFAGRACDKLEVTLICKESSFGVSLHVVSSDIEWVNHVLSRIGEEIERGKPKSSWLRSKPGRVMISFTTPLTIISAVFTLLFPKLPSGARPDAIRESIAVWIAATCWFLIFDRFHDWLTPRFEIVKEGSSSAGVRHAGWIAAQVLALAVAVIAGIIAAHLSLNCGASDSATWARACPAMSSPGPLPRLAPRKIGD
jgi:hypothetical protein